MNYRIICFLFICILLISCNETERLLDSKAVIIETELSRNEIVDKICKDLSTQKCSDFRNEVNKATLMYHSKGGRMAMDYLYGKQAENITFRDLLKSVSD